MCCNNMYLEANAGWNSLSLCTFLQKYINQKKKTENNTKTKQKFDAEAF